MRVKWGAMLEKGAYSALLGRSAVKEYIRNENPLIDGVQVLYPKSGAKVEANEVSFVIVIIGSSSADALAKFKALRVELEKGSFTLQSDTLGMTFRMEYKGCNRIYSYGRVMKMHVEAMEPNPKNR